MTMRGKFTKQRKWIFFLLLVIVLVERVPGFSQPSEYLLKAVFIEKFTRFIEWPEHHQFADSTQSFIIGILGENPFEVDLRTLFQNQSIKGKTVEIRYYRDIDEISGCDLLFISKSEEDHIQRIIDHLDEKPILTIGDSDAFSGTGVIINLFIADNKIRFEIDEQAVHRAGFHVSYLLLKEAVIVNSNSSREIR